MSPAQQVTSILVVVGLLSFPVVNARAQIEMQHRIRVPHNASLSVFKQVERSAARLNAKLYMGQATALDYAVLATNMRVMFAHMDEIGLTAEIEAYILANPDRFTRFPDEPELQELFSKVPEDQRILLVQNIRIHGLKFFHSQIVGMLDHATNMALLHDRTRLMPAAFPQTPADPNDTDPCNSAKFRHSVFYSGWASLYLGVVGMVVGGPIGLGLGIASLGFGMFGMWC